MRYQVHQPTTGKVTIKHGGKIMKFFHNDIVDEQAFFSRYPHIFKERPDLSDDIPVVSVQQRELPKEEEFVPVNPFDYDPVPVPIPVMETKIILEEQPEEEEEDEDLVNDKVGEHADNVFEDVEDVEEQAVADVDEESVDDESMDEDEVDDDLVDEQVDELPREKLKIELAGKGWYIIVDSAGKQVFPEDNKKARLKVVEEKLEELNSN